MSIRAPSFREYCYVCEQVAASTCPRCERAVCSTHATSKESRCARCEAEFYGQPGRLKDVADQSRLLGTLTAGLGFTGAATLAAIGVTTAAIAVGIGAAVLTGAVGIKALADRRHRRRFLKRRAEERKLLGAGNEEREI